MSTKLQMLPRQMGKRLSTMQAIWISFKEGRTPKHALDYHKKNLPGFAQFCAEQEKAEGPRAVPILFSPDMMRAVWTGEKTQTRRLANSPQGKIEIGDLLYTREAFRCIPAFDHLPPKRLTAATVDYEADDTDFNAGGKYRPAMHMPRFMSRAVLTVQDIKCERVQDITEADALAEGVKTYQASLAEFDGLDINPIELFKMLWDSTYGEIPGKAWADNPKIIAPVFTLEKRNIDDPIGGAAS